MLNYPCSRNFKLQFGTTTITKHSRKKNKKNWKLTMNLHRKCVRHAQKSCLHANTAGQWDGQIWFACYSRAFLTVTCHREGRDFWREERSKFFHLLFLLLLSLFFYYEDIDPNVVNWNSNLHFLVSIYYKTSPKKDSFFLYFQEHFKERIIVCMQHYEGSMGIVF